jgi:hypothetical protein
MSDYTLVQDFHDDEQVFRVGTKPLSISSVDAAYGNRNRVVPVAAAHLTREIPQDYCRSGSSIDPSRSALNYSMLNIPMQATAIADRAIALMEQHGIKWRSLPKNRIMAVETIISPPPGFVGDLDAFFADGLHWTEYTAFGHQVSVIAAIVHNDELGEDEMGAQMTAPHLHVLTLPITTDGRLDGHELVGFTGKHRNRNESFYQHVGQRYGLGKPTPKASLNKADRAQFADRLLAKFVADCPAWACNAAAMKALRRMFLADPLGMAKAHKIALPHADQAEHQGAGTAYMRSMRLPSNDAGLPAPKIDRMPVNAVGASGMPDAGVAGPVATLQADPEPQPVMPMPIRIELVAVGPDHAADADELPEQRTVIRDADIPADRWSGDQGDFIDLPPPRPSARAQAMRDIRQLLGMTKRRQEDRARQVPALLDPNHSRAGQDDQQLDVLPEPMLDAA